MNEKLVELEALARPLNEWLLKNYGAHHSVVIDVNGATLLQGMMYTPVYPKKSAVSND